MILKSVRQPRLAEAALIAVALAAGIGAPAAAARTIRFSGFTRTATTDAAGKFVFRNLPPNPYHITVEAQGFKTLERDVSVRSAVPLDVDLQMALAGASESVEVIGHAEDLLERDPTAHTDIDQTLIEKLPTFHPMRRMASTVRHQGYLRGIHI